MLVVAETSQVGGSGQGGVRPTNRLASGAPIDARVEERMLDGGARNHAARQSRRGEGKPPHPRLELNGWNLSPGVR